MKASAHSVIGLSAILFPVSAALAQTSSLGVAHREEQGKNPPPPVAREAPHQERNAVYDSFAWITLPPVPPKTFKPGDLLTIVVREQRQWEADAELETERRFRARSEFDAFLKLTNGGVGAATFQRGKPNVDYQLRSDLRSEGDTSREDRLTTRLTARIIDVKPNGLLVLEAKARVEHDEETSQITLTGTCRKEDVTADNTVLSTQIADKDVVITNEGALRSAAQRGWITKVLDWLKPL